MKYGYARVSMDGQSVDPQVGQLANFPRESVVK
jgi:hypothetical protein